MRIIALALFLAVPLAACQSEPPKKQAAAPAKPAAPIDESTLEIVGKRYDVRVTNTGYRPRELKMKVGEPATLVFVRTTESACGESVVIPSIDAQVDLPLNKAVGIPFTPSETGEVGFACGMDMMKGAILVTE